MLLLGILLADVAMGLAFLAQLRGHERAISKQWAQYVARMDPDPARHDSGSGEGGGRRHGLLLGLLQASYGRDVQRSITWGVIR